MLLLAFYGGVQGFGLSVQGLFRLFRSNVQGSGLAL